MSLTSALALRTPLVWISTDEPGRVLDTVIAHERSRNKRNLYRIDNLDGLMRYVWSFDSWRQVLVPDSQAPSGMRALNNLGEALPHVAQNGGIMLIEHAHTLTEALLGFFTSIHHRFRETIYTDDLTKLPAQFLLLSHKDDIPGEISRLVTQVGTELPTADQLRTLSKRLTPDIPQLALDKVVRAAKGMGELEFVTTALESMRKHGHIDDETVNRAKLDHFKQQGILEVRTPHLNLNSLGGLDNAKELIERIAWIWREPHNAEQYGVEPLRRLLLIGVPGSGKSLLAECTAATLNLDLAKGGVSNAMNKFVGESEANMRKMFKLLRAMEPIVFWMDEFGREMSGGASSGTVDGGTTDRVHGEFLTGLQELSNDVFLVGAANRIDDLPPEMTRADRFDVIMFVGFPTLQEREDIFTIHLGKRAHDFDVTTLAEATPMFTGAEIKALIKSVRFRVGAGERRHITTADVLRDIPNVRGRVWINHRPAIIAMYQRALSEWDWASSGQQAEAEQVLKLATTPVTASEPPSAPAVVGGIPIRKM